MSDVWVVMPSARPEAEVNPILKLWRDQGYMTAVFRDTDPETFGSNGKIDAHLILTGVYFGYAAAINHIIHVVATTVEHSDWFVAAADDIEPDPNKKASVIAQECNEYFSSVIHHPYIELPGLSGTGYQTFGVMQPTGDRWGADDQWAQWKFPDAPAYIDRICGSAWIGREFIERTYGGRGPFFPGYRHMYCDEELHEVAKKLGVLWQRPDLTHLHHHWIRERPGLTLEQCPEFLRSVNSPEAWQAAKALFDERKAQGWPGAI